MKSLEELIAERDEAYEQAQRWSRYKERNVGNCPSDLQAYDMAWRKFQDLRFQVNERIKAKQDACKHRWEETEFGVAYWSKGTHQYTCKRCGKMNMITLGIDHERTKNV